MGRILIQASAVLLFGHFTASAFIINVPGDYPSIQQGIDASVDGDTVLVQPGIYLENLNFNGHNIRLGSLYMTTGDTAFIGQTVIDGDSAGSVVTFANNEDSSAVITGFTIQNGGAVTGGGIYCLSSDPVIVMNIIRFNVAGFGAGIYCEHASPSISFNRIEGNVAWLYENGIGGGIYCVGNSAPLIACNNITGNGASGLWYGEGGGISTQSWLTPVIVNNLIRDNGCSGIYGGAGGGICSFSGSIILNNIIVNNYASGSMELAGGIYCGDNTALLINNIIRDNSSEEIIGNAVASYCDIEGGWPGQGNIDVDPLFRNPDHGDFHLMSVACGDPYDSPCIDDGDPGMLDSLLDCSWGLGGLRSDMGAYGGGDSLITGIVEQMINPEKIVLMTNFPDPFNSKTNIQFEVDKESNLSVRVYDILGQMVVTLFEGYGFKGRHTLIWDASDFPSGVYFYRIEDGGCLATGKMILLK